MHRLTRSKSRSLLLCWLLTGLFCASAASAAKPLAPPTNTLLSEHNRLALVRIEAKPAADRLQVKALEQLHGETPEQLEVRGSSEVFSTLQAGQEVLLSYSTVRKNPLLRDVRELDPDGAKTTSIVLLKSVVLSDSANLRILLQRPGTKASAKDLQKLLERQLQALLKELSHPTAANRRLAVAEFFTRKDLRDLIGKKHHRALARAFDNPTLELDAKDFLLRGTLLLPVERRGLWLVKSSRGIVEAAEPQLDLTSSTPSLVQSASWAIRDAGKGSDAPLFSKLLYSNNPGVAKAALDAMDRLDPELALATAQKALGGELQEEARRVISIYAERAAE